MQDNPTLYRPLLQREEASLTSMRGEVVDHTDTHVLVSIGLSRRGLVMQTRWVVMQRFPHYLGIIHSFTGEGAKKAATTLWERQFKPVVPTYDEYTNSQNA